MLNTKLQQTMPMVNAKIADPAKAGFLFKNVHAAFNASRHMLI